MISSDSDFSNLDLNLFLEEKLGVRGLKLELAEADESRLGLNLFRLRLGLWRILRLPNPVDKDLPLCSSFSASVNTSSVSKDLAWARVLALLLNLGASVAGSSFSTVYFLALDVDFLLASSASCNLAFSFSTLFLSLSLYCWAADFLTLGLFLLLNELTGFLVVTSSMSSSSLLS